MLADGITAQPRGVPPTVTLDAHAHPESVGDHRAGEHRFDRTRGHHGAGPKQGGVSHPGRDLLEVVGHEHEGRHRRVGGQGGQPSEQALPGPEVETGGGLVHEEQLGFAHEGTSQEHLLALPLRQQAEGRSANDGSPKPASAR